MPPQMHLVLATRVDPGFPLARLRVRNQINEFRVSDLCFTREETAQFFNKVMKLDLSNQDITILESRTEGWVAGLQLAALSLQGRSDISGFIREFAGDNRLVVDYLAEEVLNLQSEQIQIFLLRTSILNRLSGSLCDDVTDCKGGQEILDGLERANLFILPLDNKRGWYRYHHLFAELLRQRLNHTQSELVPELHIRASKWFEKNGLIDEAVDHALIACDFERAASLIGGFAETAWECGRKARLFKWFEVLPAEFISKKPNLSFFHAWVLFENGQYNAADEKLQSLEKMIDSTDKHADINQAAENDYLRGKLAAIRARIATGCGNFPDIFKYSEMALQYLPDADLSWRATIFLSLGVAFSIKGDMAAAIDAFTQARILGKKADNDHLFLNASYWLVTRLKYAGQLRQSIDICKQLLAVVEERQMPDYVIGAGLFVNWGDILYEVNEIDAAYHNVNKGLSIVNKHHEVAARGWCYFCLLRVLLAQGNISGIEDILLELEKLKRERDVPTWVTHLTDPWRARFWMTRGALEKAVDWMEQREFSLEEPLVPFYEPEYIVFARILVARNKIKEAMALIDALLKDEKKGGRILSQIETQLVKALAFEMEGHTKEALATVEEALLLAEPGGYIRVFVDEGPPMAELLEKLNDGKAAVSRTYIKKLLSAFRLEKIIETEDGLVDSLSDRELEVLRLIAAGLSNKKITEALFVSLSTVKTHLRNIYGKLNVHSRTEAMAKAKELELL